MAEITIHRTGMLLRKLFEILMDSPEGLGAKDAIATLKNNVEMTDYEKGEYPSGGLRFDKIIRFATVDCRKAGWLVKDKGIWSLTDEGIQAYQRYKEPEKFYRQAQRLYKDWKKKQKEIVPEEEVDAEVENKSAIITFEEAEEQAWSEIENYLKNMPPYDLQKLVAALLKAMGYYVSWISPPGKDGGIDILAWNDPLGTRPPRIKVQVKRELTAVNVSTLRSFMALLGDNDVGLFVSTGGFTRDSEDEARTQQSRQVTLLNLQRLFELWVEHSHKMDEESRTLLPLKPIHFLLPNE